MLDNIASALSWTATGDSITNGDVEAWCTYTGQQQGEVQGWGWLNALHPDDRKRAIEAWKQGVQHKSAYMTSYRIRRYDGDYQEVKAQAIPLFEHGRELREWVVIYTDEPEEPTVEKSDWESSSLYRIVFERVTVGIICYDIEGNILRANPQFSAITGFSQEELLHLKIDDMGYPEEADLSLNCVRDLLLGKESTCKLQSRYMRKDGTLIWVRLEVVVMRSSAGALEYFIMLVEDITRLVQAEEERTRLLAREQTARLEAVEQQNQLEAIFESMSDGVLVFDREANVLRANAALYTIFKYEDELHLSLHSYIDMLQLRDENGQLLAEEQWPLQRVLRGETLRGEETIDILARHPKGYDLYLNAAGAPLRDEQNRIIGGVLVFRDVTERRQLEHRMSKAFKMLLKLEEELSRISAYPEEQLVSEAAQEPATTERIIRNVGQRIVELTAQNLECRFVSIFLSDVKSETLRPLAGAGLSLQVGKPAQEEDYLSMISSYISTVALPRLRSNQIVINDLTRYHLPEQQPGYLLRKLLIAPMMLGEQLMGVLCLDKKSPEQMYTSEDIELAKAAARLILLVIERERLQHEWIEARTNERALQEVNRRFDEFLSIASHELRTPLTTIRGNIQLTLRRLQTIERQEGEESKNKEEFDRLRVPLLYAQHRVNVQNRMIGDLLDVSRIQANKFELLMRACNLAKVVHEAVEDQRYMAPERTIELDMPSDENIMVMADADRISQVVHNYLGNALKYAPVDRPIRVRLEKENELVRVSVTDEGPGLSPEDQQHVWERFYRVKGIETQSGSVSGLGLGLHICRIIIERHHGRFGLESTPGKGSTFWFALPLISSSSTGASSAM